MIDSGISNVNDFQSMRDNRIVYSADFTGGNGNNQYGYGTHVSGILGGLGAGTVYMGVAPGVNLINLRALDANGAGTDSAVISAINAAVSLKDTYNIRVINLSLGRPVFESASQDPLCLAVEAAWKAGIVVVVAAGNQGRNNSANNNGYGTICAPALI